MHKKIFSGFCVILVIANLLFLFLGALLYLYSESVNFQLPSSTDDLYPLLVLNELGFLISIIFILGIIAAAYSSADSALTSLTTSFCIDFLDIQKRNNKRKIRLVVHVGFSILLFIVILIFNEINDESVINSIFKAAGYTYGPLLGLFSFGIFTKYKDQRQIGFSCLSYFTINKLFGQYILRGYIIWI